MNKPFYKSTGVMGSLAVIVSALVALVASLASLKGLEITPENQALIVSLVMTLAGGVAALIGRMKATDVMFSDVLVSEMVSSSSLPGVQPDIPWERPSSEKLSSTRVWPVPPEDEECPACHGKFGAHFSSCPGIGTAPQAVFPGPVPGDLGTTLSRLVEVLERIHAAPEDFVKDQAGCPSKDPAEPMAEGQLVGDQSPGVVNG